jgi:hypothetical protein
MGGAWFPLRVPCYNIDFVVSHLPYFLDINNAHTNLAFTIEPVDVLLATRYHCKWHSRDRKHIPTTGAHEQKAFRNN